MIHFLGVVLGLWNGISIEYFSNPIYCKQFSGVIKLFNIAVEVATQE